MLNKFQDKRSLKQCLIAMAELNSSVFDCYVHEDYVQNKLLYEKKVHHWKSLAFKYLTRITHHSSHTFLVNLYEIIFCLGSLRYRVTDFTIFSVANNEIKNLAEGLTSSLRNLAKWVKSNATSYDLSAILTDDIYQFEEVNRSALQIVAYDPMIFILFIHHLKEMTAGLSDLAMNLSGLNAE